MSYVNFSNGEFIFHDAEDKPRRILELLNPAANQSDLTQAELVNRVQGNLKKIFDGTLDGMNRAIIFFRIVARLIRKPQIHNVLHIGNWSPLDEVLAEILPQFNPENFLWSYAPMRPLRKFEHVNFVHAEVDGGYIVSQNKFDTIIFSEQKLPPLEILLAPKDFGEIFFTAPNSELPDYLTPAAQIFELARNFSLIEVEMSPTLKRELYKLTPQGKLDDVKNLIRQTIYKFRDVVKNFYNFTPQEQNSILDRYLAEVTRVEKILAEIFPQLQSDTIKQNFNVFKELLIDVRLYEDWQLKNRAVEDLNRHTPILLQDLRNL